eukprot:363740-Chlamydomonas_euryale.AAC.4
MHASALRAVAVERVDKAAKHCAPWSSTEVVEKSSMSRLIPPGLRSRASVRRLIYIAASWHGLGRPCVATAGCWATSSAPPSPLLASVELAVAQRPGIGHCKRVWRLVKHGSLAALSPH